MYVGQNSVYNAYIGNEALQNGTNPFIVQPPSPSDEKSVPVWIIILSILAVILLGALFVIIYKCRQV